MKTNTATGQLLEEFKQRSQADYIGEPVSQLEHSLQAAALAVQSGADEPLILAALLHDVGHWCSPGEQEMPGLGALHHEQLGQRYLDKLGLHPEIGQLVGMHVDAKRYLASSVTGYLEKLPPASAATLQLQGGPMSAQEQLVFQQVPLFSKALQLRAWDEAAKDPDAEVQGIDRYASMLRRNLASPLSGEQLASWQEKGFLHLRDWYDAEEMTSIIAATGEMQVWPEAPGKWMKYFEQPGGDRMLCRVENFLQYQPLFDRVARGASTLRLLSQLMDAEAVLFKEKINFKLPGGQGFAPHQDAPAFTSFGQRYHITMMLSIDESTRDNGCLEIAETPKLDSLLPMNGDLTIAPGTVEAMTWRPVETSPGDLVLFDSYLPHRSGINGSSVARRALYATYNRMLEGDCRDQYFEKKRASFPPEVERVAGVTYDEGVFNVGNPVSVEG